MFVHFHFGRALRSSTPTARFWRPHRSFECRITNCECRVTKALTNTFDIRNSSLDIAYGSVRNRTLSAQRARDLQSRSAPRPHPRTNVELRMSNVELKGTKRNPFDILNSKFVIRSAQASTFAKSYADLLHHGHVIPFLFIVLHSPLQSRPREGSNLDQPVRSRPLYPLSYESRYEFRIANCECRMTNALPNSFDIRNSSFAIPMALSRGLKPRFAGSKSAVLFD